MQVDKAHGTVAHDEKGATDWAVSSSQLTRQFLVKHVSPENQAPALCIICRLCQYWVFDDLPSVFLLLTETPVVKPHI